MWKKIKMNDPHERQHQESMMGHHTHKDVHQLSVDCSRAHRGMFAGVLVIVLTIISLIMFFVLDDETVYKAMAVMEVTYSEICLYLVTAGAVAAAMYKMQDLKYSKQYRELKLKQKLLKLANFKFFNAPRTLASY
jgi:Otopetrin